MPTLKSMQACITTATTTGAQRYVSYVKVLTLHCKDNLNYKVGDWRVQFSYAGRHGEEFTAVRKEYVSVKFSLMVFLVRLGDSRVERLDLTRPVLVRTLSCSDQG